MYLLLSICLFVLSNFIVGNLAMAQDSCITAECHVDIGTAKFLHGPLAAGECTVCHVKGKNDRPPKQHDLTDYKDGEALCLGCHEKTADFLKGKKKHGPIEEGECIVCHDPHQANNKFLLTEDFVPDLCFNCHENNMTVNKYVHGPLAGGDCIVCHDPHASKNEFLLTTERLTLCFNCHGEKKADFEKAFVHQPFKESCEKCHDPHGSQFKMHLKDEQSTLCWECHKEFVEQMEQSKSKHTAISKNGCLGCHLPHASDHSKGLRETKKNLCVFCHKDMQEKILASRYLHGPVQEGDCLACHNPHASEYAKHLVNFFPDEFYFEYKVDNYSMCFECHNNEVATEQFTDTLTDFRNGDLNLHFLHVNREKGRSCKACHELHAGDQEKHISRAVPFGTSNWMLPIKYTKTETGGGCVVGCHKPKLYDRENPVQYEEVKVVKDKTR